MQDLIQLELNLKVLYYECGIYICFLKILKNGDLRKTKVTEVLILVFQNQKRKTSFVDFKDSMDQKENII